MHTTVVKRGLNDWASFLNQIEIPVLASTGQSLSKLRQNEDDEDARLISRIVLRDPLMTVKLLRYLQQHKRGGQQSEIILVEQAILMLGINPFYKNVPDSPTVESMLETCPEAQTCLLQVLDRSRRAAEFAVYWAARLNDLHFDEIYIAALLHDLAEILLWCFSPMDMLQIHQLQSNDRNLRSRVAQESVMGFSFQDLGRLLIQQWSLPQLLQMLLDPEESQHSRVRNVILAVNLARHSARGWEDPALPDDYRDIGALLHLPVEKVMEMVCPNPSHAPEIR